MPNPSNDLIQAAAAMHEHTRTECAKCPCPHSCCSGEYCDLVKADAKELWDVDLPETGHPTMRFMGPNGCTVAPHFRLLCTVHTCAINSIGFKPHDPTWTAKYFSLRKKLNQYV